MGCWVFLNLSGAMFSVYQSVRRVLCALIPPLASSPCQQGQGKSGRVDVGVGEVNNGRRHRNRGRFSCGYPARHLQHIKAKMYATGADYPSGRRREKKSAQCRTSAWVLPVPSRKLHAKRSISFHSRQSDCLRYARANACAAAHHTQVRQGSGYADRL